MRKYSKSDHKSKFSRSNSSKNQKNLSLGVKLGVIFGGVITIIGIAFTVLGLAIMIPFTMLIDFNDMKFSKDSPITSGEVIKVEGTNSYSNDVQIFEYFYRYTVQGKIYENSSFATGKSNFANLKIQYLKESPEISRISGMNSGNFPVWILLFLSVFPIIGILMIFFGIKKRLVYLRILQVGKVTFGIYKRRETTGSSVNEQAVYRLFFDFIADDGKTYQAHGETHNTYKLEDEQFEPLVFNPQNPSEAIMIDGLPASVRKAFATEIENAKKYAEENGKKLF